MSFMKPYLHAKGTLYSADCDCCGCTMFAHEWASPDFNEDRDAMQNGTARCPECSIGHADPDTFMRLRDSYAARYSAAGYMDCTDWHYGTNERALLREIRDFYGE